MINLAQARKYCREDLSLIYGYDEAIADKENMWDIHHTLGLVYSKKELIEKGLYYNQPAEYLMFVTRSQHMILHNIRGAKGSLKGKHLSEETKKKMSEAQKGVKNHMYGKTGDEHNSSKAVLQIDKQTGEVIKIWPCAIEVQRVLGINNGNISLCCSGKKKSAGGYIWRFADI